jgi:hypothetical protein
MILYLTNETITPCQLDGMTCARMVFFNFASPNAKPSFTQPNKSDYVSAISNTKNGIVIDPFRYGRQ